MRTLMWQLGGWWRRRRGDADTESVLPDETTPAVGELFDALTAEARPHELVGLSEPLARYRADLARPVAATTSTKGTPVFTTLFGARTGAAVAGVAIGLGAVSIVAYAATRPPAETVMISPASTESPDGRPSDRPVGPDATGPAAKGLCNAWANHQKHQDGVERAEGSVAMRNLAAAAGGEDKIAAYCATIPHPGKGPKSGKGPKTADEREDADDERGQPTKPGKDTPTPAEPSPSPSTSGTPDPTPTDTHTTATSPPSTPTTSPSSGG